MAIYSYLALGDSYTIGEQVLPGQNFPNQTVALLNKITGGVDNRNQYFMAPEIIASTGWTTDELITAINAASITKQYEVVSLLIGVNNQYRGRTVKNFVIEFEYLLQRAIQFANNKPGHVFVLSIPDWSVTTFAEGRDTQKIAMEIDAYNSICKSAAQKFATHFTDITTSQRIDGKKNGFLADDKLHPSGKEYAKWAIQLASAIEVNLKE